MSAWAGGAAIFGGALRALVARPLVVAGLFAAIAVPTVALDLVDLWSFHADPDAYGTGGWGLARLAVETLVLAVAVVGWHRAVLRPGAPDPSVRRWVAYGLAYLVIGLAIGLVLAPPAALVLAGLGIAANVAETGAAMPYGVIDLFATGLDALYGLGGVEIAFALLGVPFLWLLYRCGMGLPHIAVADRPMRMGESWAATRPLARPIAVLALVAAAAQAVPLFGPTAYALRADLPFTFAAEAPLAVLAALGYAATILVGAAILTEIYRRITPPPP
ncbi:hypothetical protein JQC91_03420 [Jannaschia sp. Os4]|uniref:hypothetical protein n=1 Tax=Jannaschia sp. Os4 TaxID=2807617 RepID=UPI0019394C9C|nr:hypothetical protein [Jannaschia sp. Os4]MBM2575345.1 hypothetical protein [Jannaschia sp. Os4]